MTLRSRKKPPTTALKPTTARKHRFHYSVALAAGLWLSLGAVSVAQTKKPTWSAQRPAPQKSLSSVAIPQPSATRPSTPTRTLSSTLLAPHEVNRKSFVPVPRMTSGDRPIPAPMEPQVAATSGPDISKHNETLAGPTKQIILTPAAAPTARETQPSRDEPRHVAATQRPTPQMRAVATSRSFGRLALRTGDSTLLAPHEVDRKSFEPAPPIINADRPVPAHKKPQVAATSWPDASEHNNTAAGPTKQIMSTPAAAPTARETQPTRDEPRQVAATQRPTPQMRASATSRSVGRLTLRTAEMPTLRPTPKSKRQRTADIEAEPNALASGDSGTRVLQAQQPRPATVAQNFSTRSAKVRSSYDEVPSPMPNVRQPGSLRLVQFEDPSAPSDEIDFDSALPDFFDLPNESAASTPSPVEAPAPPPSPNSLFDQPATAEEDPSETLFLDQTPPETVVTPQPALVQPLADDKRSETATGAESKTESDEFPQSGAELQAEIEEAISTWDPLPTLTGDNKEEDDITLPPSVLEAFENPLDDTTDTEPSASGRDLSSTNGRDCLAGDQECEDLFALLRRREQTDFSIDITPSIEPREFDMTKVEQVRVEKLAKAPSRTWTDRSGQVIADGTFEDYRNGKVVVRTVNGTMRSIPDYQLSNEDRCFVNAWWELPDECHFEDEQFVMRDFRMTTFTWTAAATCHKPLYFEEVSVERYGHTAGPIIQPLASGVHFFGNILMMPYHMGLTPPNECVYPLGYYRPGDCAPWIVPGFPMTTRGFKWEAMALGAGIALLP